MYRFIFKSLRFHDGDTPIHLSFREPAAPQIRRKEFHCTLWNVLWNADREITFMMGWSGGGGGGTVGSCALVIVVVVISSYVQ